MLAPQERGKELRLGDAYGNQQATNDEQLARFSMPDRFSNENDRGQKFSDGIDGVRIDNERSGHGQAILQASPFLAELGRDVPVPIVGAT